MTPVEHCALCEGEHEKRLKAINNISSPSTNEARKWSVTVIKIVDVYKTKNIFSHNHDFNLWMDFYH